MLIKFELIYPIVSFLTKCNLKMLSIRTCFRILETLKLVLIFISFVFPINLYDSMNIEVSNSQETPFIL